ncbi:sulfotransferase domain-containing protein [Aequorivita antarctica]|uniref:Sulfotransferase domain-containing protein n=1 Tax=Aequorivita antarctica TaxID=153266 RepID=A0A5C6YZ91_9FLAO|nr:sulfotransferase domain-containing protein [Aequorivita antarctica]TXD72511.1 sulfotransferase domain-containing protein [Aequorivita antarctica]SRX75395.1 hypothetical protein AEQU3_02389 [Aequorivita antarctica]
MWVFCCGPVRSGSTLQFNITRELVEKSNSGYAVDYDYTDNFSKVYERYNDEKLKVFKTHSLSPLMIELINNKKAVAIYCYRDVRDVIVSIAKKEDNVVSNLVLNNKFILGYVDYYNLIKNLPYKLMSKYEDFYNNIPRECRRIASILNIKANVEVINQIEKEYSRDKLISNIDKDKMDQFVGKNGKTYTLDKKTLIHFNHFGNYYPGSYVMEMSQSEIDKIEKGVGTWLLINGYKVDLMKYFILRLKLIKKRFT